MEFNATFLATIVSFIIFIFLMNKILYAPILDIIEKRKNFIDENYKSAAQNKDEANALIEKIEDKRNVAKDDARIQYSETIDEFKNQKKQVILEAQKAANEELSASNLELNSISNKTKESLKDSMVGLANDIVEKIIGYKPEVQGFDNEKIDEILYK
ncbi:MAG: ATP synthase F0 subunit B [Cyanobacteria bacterium SIG27]|nr:ATP synthase F0 subunit B [Cyanobacteria bacterium SIG27]